MAKYITLKQDKMNKMEKEKTPDIYEVFDIEPVAKKEVAAIPEVIENDPAQDSFDADFEEARKNLLYLIDNAKEALEDVRVIAREKEGAKEYEAFNQLLRTVGDASGNLLKFHEMRKKFREKSKSKEEMKNGIAVNNAVFVGSSSELRKMLDNS